MVSTTFKSAKPAITPAPMPRGKISTQGEIIREEVPYTEYVKEHNHPYLVDHFKLGDTWDNPKGGFPKEIELIDNYLKEKIELGELPNNLESIKTRIKEMEKINKLGKEPRAVVRIETLAAYIKFLKETDNINLNLSRYGH